MNRLLPARLLVATALIALSALAQAQYMWIDEKGVKQLSDHAPPASVPLKNILKAPRGAAGAASRPSETDAGAATAAATAPDAAKSKGAAAPTLAERNADYRKRVKENLEREQKEKEESAAKAERQANCESARSARQSMDAGDRIGIRGKDGERGFMSDEQRAVESKKIDQALAGCK